MVAIFNPGTADSHVAKVSVPHGNFSAHFFNETSKNFDQINASVICEL